MPDLISIDPVKEKLLDRMGIRKRNGACFVCGSGRKCRSDAFGVPLQSKNREGFMLNGFHAVICGTPLKGMKSFSDFVYALMMSAVDHDCLAQGIVKTRVGEDGSGMVLIPLPVPVECGGGHMLCERAAEGYVDQLHPFADAQHRETFLTAEFQGVKLQNIQFGINVA